MPVYKISRGMRIVLGHCTYQIVAVLPDGKVRLRNLKDNKYRSESEQTILQAAVHQDRGFTLLEIQTSTSSSESRPKNRHAGQPPQRLSIHFKKLDLQIVCRTNRQVDTEQPWIAVVVDAVTRLVLGFALVRKQELTSRLSDWGKPQPSRPSKYDSFGGRMSLPPSDKRTKHGRKNTRLKNHPARLLQAYRA